MSKIGKISINIPEKVKVALAGSDINIEGPLGKQKLKINLEMFDFKIDDGKNVSIKPKKLDDDTKRLWGMNRSLLNNAIIGASKGYEKTLELVGVGYRAALKGKQLNLQLGFSHDIKLAIPSDLEVKCTKPTEISISGIDKQKVGQFASEVRSINVAPFRSKTGLYEPMKDKLTPKPFGVDPEISVNSF